MIAQAPEAALRVNNLVAADLANEAGSALLNVLRHWTDALGRHGPTLFLRASHVVDVVVGVHALAQRLDIGLLALVGEERRGLLRCRRGARQRASAHRDICEELGDLKRVSALLQELVVDRLHASLLRLLFSSARANLRLRAR